MVNINEKDFERFFFYGIENKKALDLSVIFFSIIEINSKIEGLQNLYDIPNEDLLNKIVILANNRYKQIERFINYNDQEYNLKYRVDSVKTEKIIKRMIETLIQENLIMITKAGIYFNKYEICSQGYSYDVYGDLRYDYAKGLIGEEAWTRKIYNILINLEKLEKENILEYYDRWLFTKLQRAKSREDKQEIEKMEKVYKIFQERKQKQLQKRKMQGKEIGEE